MNILITGATSGIGKQLALDYKDQRHQVWALGRNETALQELQDKGMHTGQLNLTDRDQSLRIDLKKGQSEIHFPKRFTLIMKLLSWLPTPVWTQLAQKMVK